MIAEPLWERFRHRENEEWGRLSSEPLVTRRGTACGARAQHAAPYKDVLAGWKACLTKVAFVNKDEVDIADLDHLSIRRTLSGVILSHTLWI